MFVDGGTTKTKPDVFSLESLIAWLEKQPADKGYVYSCNGHCLLAQYFIAMGFKNVSVGATWVRLDESHEQMPRYFNSIAQHTGVPMEQKRRTFGAAISRARKAAQQR